MLSDEEKRKQYDTWGSTAENMGMGGGASGPQGFEQNWRFHSSVDPEELFRKIFGEAGFKTGAFRSDFGEEFAESAFGFGAAQEVWWCVV